MRAPVSLAAATVLLVGGCGTSGGGDQAQEPTVPATHRSLAAAVTDAVRGPAGTGPSAAAPLFPRDEVAEGDLGVELAFPREVGDALHVRVVVAHGEVVGRSDLDCDGDAAEFYAGCEEGERGEGPDRVRTVLAWEAEAPEEDPGIISVVADRGRGSDRVVVYAVASGPPLAEDLGDQRELADALVDLVADPTTGFTTTPALVEGGERIGDDVWLDYYGQGNGYPPPRGS